MVGDGTIYEYNGYGQARSRNNNKYISESIIIKIT